MISGVPTVVPASEAAAAKPAPRLAGPEWFSVGYDGTKAVVSITGEIGIFNHGAGALLSAVDRCDEIELVISSPGGDSACAFELVDGFAGRVSRATIIGDCFSAAVTLALAAKKRICLPTARMMIHRAQAFQYGDHDALRFAAAKLEKLNQRLAEWLQERTGQPEGIITAWLNGRDHYFSAEQAEAFSLVHEIISLPAPAVIPPPIVGQTRASAAPASPTDDEKVLQQILEAFGPVKVRDRAAFARNLAAWALHNSRKDTSCEL